MRLHALICTTLLLTSCGFNNRFELPSQINSEVTIKDSTQTVNVTHTVGISLEMTTMFQTACTAEVDASVPPPPEPLRTELIKLCVAEATQKFIESILAIIKQGSQP